MTQVAIIEDEENTLEYLKFLLKQHCPSVAVLGNASTVHKSIELIHKTQPELVFMDVELNGEMSFSIFEKLISPVNFEVIFTTGYSQYALQAIKYSCLEYLLKPIDPNELVIAVQKFEEKKKTIVHQKQLEILQHNVAHISEKVKKIAIPSADGFMLINIFEIVLCISEANYTWVYTSRGEKILSSRNLKWFEETLPEEAFFRCHKSTLINLNHIKRFSKSEGYKVYMEGGHTIDVATRLKDDFLKRITNI